MKILSIKKTLTSAYYTPREIVDFIYKRLETYGFNGNNNIEILEPAIGSGVFIERMPSKIRGNSHITAVEIDQVTSKIVKALYPDINLHTWPGRTVEAFCGNLKFSFSLYKELSG